MTWQFALPALQSGIERDDRLFHANNKTFDENEGSIEMIQELVVSLVDDESGEIGGAFVQTQLGDYDMRAHDPCIK